MDELNCLKGKRNLNGKMCLPRLSLQFPLLPQRRTRSPRKEAPLRVLGQRPPVTIAKATAPCWTLWVALRSALTCRSETGSPVPAEYGVSRHPTRARPVDSGEGKGAGPGAAWLQTKESPTPSRGQTTSLCYCWTSLPPRSQRSLFHRPAFPYLRVQPTRCASQGDPRSSKAKVWEG